MNKLPDGTRFLRLLIIKETTCCDAEQAETALAKLDEFDSKNHQATVPAVGRRCLLPNAADTVKNPIPAIPAPLGRRHIRFDEILKTALSAVEQEPMPSEHDQLGDLVRNLFRELSLRYGGSGMHWPKEKHLNKLLERTLEKKGVELPKGVKTANP